MRTIFSAFVWETLLRGRWLLPLGFFGGNVLSILLFATCFGKGVAITQETEFVLWHLVASQMNALAFGAVLISAQGNPQRFFTLPITNRAIAAYYLLIGMALMFAESVMSATLINALFGAGWPLWGPALFSAVALAAIYATIWVAERSFWLIVNVIVVGSAGGVWYRFRYGPFYLLDVDRIFNRGERQLHFWEDVTIAELLTLSAAAFVAYSVAVIGLSWRRRGEDAVSLGFVAWANRLLDPPLEVGPPFRSPVDAQYWFERRKKASIIPAILIICTVFGLIFWLIFDRDPLQLFRGLYAGGWALIGVGLIGGMICGNAGSGEAGDGDAASEMGHFLGTRPLTSKSMANILLKVAIRGVATGWLMWIAAVVLLYLLLLAFGAVERGERWADPNVLWGSLLGSWMAAGVGLCVLLLGRPRVLMILALSTIVLAIAWLIGSTFFVPLEARAAVEEWTSAIVGIAAIAATGTAFVVAWRGGMISTATAIGGQVLWSLLSVLAVWIAYRTNMPVASTLFVTGIASLVAAPLAAAPLALAWNRVR